MTFIHNMAHVSSSVPKYVCQSNMMTSSDGNIFRVTGHLSGESTGPRWIPCTPVTRSFDVFFDLRLNKRLSKQSWGCWLETLWRPLWRQRNDLHLVSTMKELWYVLGLCVLWQNGSQLIYACLKFESNYRANPVHWKLIITLFLTLDVHNKRSLSCTIYNSRWPYEKLLSHRGDG